MTSAENGNQYAMALAAMKRLSTMRQTTTETLLTFAARVKVEVNRAKQDGVDNSFTGAKKDQYLLLAAAIKRGERANPAANRTSTKSIETQLTTQYSHVVNLSPVVKLLKQEMIAQFDDYPPSTPPSTQ